MPSNKFNRVAYLAPEAPPNQNSAGIPERVPAPDKTEPQEPTKPRSSSPGTKEAPGSKR